MTARASPVCTLIASTCALDQYVSKTGRKNNSIYDLSVTSRYEPCQVTDNCLECPLPACKYDDPYYYREWIADRSKRRVNTEILELLAQGVPASEVALQVNRTIRTVFRIKRSYLFDTAGGNTK